MKIKINHKIIVLIFFIIFLFIGLNIYQDYGVSCDEWNEYERAIYSFNFLFNGSAQLVNPYYGIAFGLPVYILQKLLNITEISDIFLLRHLATFLLFYISVFFFYLIGKNIFKNKWLALTGSLFLILSPRIFAHSFYNSKDLAFLSVFIISIYTLLKYLDKKTLLRGFVHAFICAILINIRVVGIFLPALTTLFIVFNIIQNSVTRKKDTNLIFSFTVYIFLFVFFTILFWPILWDHPISNFIQAITEMAHYPWPGRMLYLGKYIQAINVPWHYIPVWLLITTPILYTVLFLTGLFLTINKFIKKPLNFYLKNKKEIIILCWFFLPLFTVIILKSVLYDSWRQMFFIYPAFLLIALSGLFYIFEFIKTKLKYKTYNLLSMFLILIIAVNSISIANNMFKNHPYQNVYFNFLTKKIFKSLKQNFEMDYWGLSYRQGLEYILANDNSQSIKIYTNGYPGFLSAYLVPFIDRQRLKFVDIKEEEADYLMSNYRWHKEEYVCDNEIYKIEIEKEKILTVCKLKK